jgi:hypothetical protein
MEAPTVAPGAYNITGSTVLTETADELVRRYFGDRTEIRGSLPAHDSLLSCAKAERAFNYRPMYRWSLTESFPEVDDAT